MFRKIVPYGEYADSDFITVPEEGGVVSPFTVYVNVYFRLTHVFSVDTLLCSTLHQYTCKQLIVR